MVAVPKLGDFGLVPGRSAVMWLTRLGTFSRYGHAAVVVETRPSRAEVDIMEAMPNGARRRTVDLLAETDWVWSRCTLSDEQRAEIVAAALACTGYPYDWPSIFGFIVRFWGSKFTGQPADHADRKVICSELVCWAYRAAGHELGPKPGLPPGDVSPGDLADHIMREGVS